MRRPSRYSYTHHRSVNLWCWSQYRWRQVTTGEFLMLKPVQVTSLVQLSEQSCSDDDDVVSFATSNAHITGPSCVFLDFLNDTTWTESSSDHTDTVTSSSSSRNTGANIWFIFALFRCCQTSTVRTQCRSRTVYLHVKRSYIITPTLLHFTVYITQCLVLNLYD